MGWPTTDDPRTEFMTTRFTVGEADDVDWLILQTGAKNRSEALRNAVDHEVARERRKARRQKQSSTPGPSVLDPEHTDEEQT